MNDKKPSKFQLYFSGVLEAFFDAKKMKKKIVSLDFGDNRDREFQFFQKKLDLSVLSIWIGYRINWIISEVQGNQKKCSFFFSIEKASSTPEE